jgi:hypothetical protein
MTMSDAQIADKPNEELQFKAAIRDYINEIDSLLRQIHQDHEAIEQSRARTEAILSEMKAQGYVERTV